MVNGGLLKGFWSAPQLEWHINRNELFAVRQAVTEVLDTLPGSSVMVQSDNRTVVSYINNQGGTKTLSLLTDTGLLLDWLKRTPSRFRLAIFRASTTGRPTVCPFSPVCRTGICLQTSLRSSSNNGVSRISTSLPPANRRWCGGTQH